MMNNPLMATNTPMAQRAPDKSMERHAAIWHGVQQMAPDDLNKHIDTATYALPILGALANNPKTTSKDVIKAAAAAAGAGKIDPTDAVSLISDMPSDPDKLQAWLKVQYQDHLTAVIHMKAAAMQAQQPAPPQGMPQ